MTTRRPDDTQIAAAVEQLHRLATGSARFTEHVAEVAARLGVNERTVYRWLADHPAPAADPDTGPVSPAVIDLLDQAQDQSVKAPEAGRRGSFTIVRAAEAALFVRGLSLDVDLHPAMRASVTASIGRSLRQSCTGSPHTGSRGSASSPSCGTCGWSTGT